jgi:hypothetical protein
MPSDLAQSGTYLVGHAGVTFRHKRAISVEIAFIFLLTIVNGSFAISKMALLSPPIAGANEAP